MEENNNVRIQCKIELFNYFPGFRKILFAESEHLLVVSYLREIFDFFLISLTLYKLWLPLTLKLPELQPYKMPSEPGLAADLQKETPEQGRSP